MDECYGHLRRQWDAIIPFLGDSIIATPTTIDSIVLQASELLFHSRYTILIASVFRPILLVLCATWLDRAGNYSEKLDAFALLLCVHEEIYSIFATFIRETKFSGGLLNDIQNLSPLQLHFRLLSYYRILYACPQAPMSFGWSPESLLDVLQMPNISHGTICLAIHSYAIHSRISESRRDEFLEKYLGPVGGSDVIIESGLSIGGTKQTINGWILPLSETLRVRKLRESLLVPNDYCLRAGYDTFIRLELTKITHRIVDVEGILLLKHPNSSKSSAQFTLTSTAKKALRAIALRLSLRLPILLSSPPSGGKNSILRYLASLLYPASTNQLVYIHLADTSFDAKSLFGSYVSSTKRPGHFEWQDGIVVTAMRQGRWLVLKDIDRANSDILGALISILDGFHIQKHIGSPVTLHLSGRPPVVAADSFSIFATSSITPRLDGSYSDLSFLSIQKFSRVEIPSLTREDLLQIISNKYPVFASSIAALFVNAWLEICCLPSIAGVRTVGVHELEAWCRRVASLISVPSIPPPGAISFLNVFPNISIREEIYFHARDIFFGTGAFSEIAKVHYDSISRIIANHLSLASDRIQWFLTNHRPEIHISKDSSNRSLSLTIGRIHLPTAVTDGSAELSSRPYATHRSAVLLLERVATSVSMQEPVLLVGETGTGKTTTVSYLSSLLNRPLISLNLSNQTESSDLLGNFKPVDARVSAGELQQRFVELFALTFSRKKNAKFEQAVRSAVSDSKWKKAVGLWKECVRLALEKIQTRNKPENDTVEVRGDTEDVLINDDGPRKRRKVLQNSYQVHESDWIKFGKRIELFDMEHVQKRSKLAFRFIEGPLVRAFRSGSWVLLDEINLASSETLECISSILSGLGAPIIFSEQGSSEPIRHHPDFRLFACMNPATDVGKRDLPMNIRTHFTEIYVPSPDNDKDALLSIVQQYIGHCAITDKAVLLDVVEFYMQVKARDENYELADGSNRRPYFSIRTLTRALMFVSHATASFGLRRALWEGCLMAFSMSLETTSAAKVRQLAERLCFSSVKNISSSLAHIPSLPSGSDPNNYERIGPFWIECGYLPKDPVPEYVLTPSVQTKLVDLARIVYARRFPILIEGPTSSGKTSAVEYLARRTGHRFVRINNHEHTDIQEYLGSYVSDPDTGRLVFKDGMLVRALRNGDWIVLDELNLAPTDVLEALNRLLDDNRELFIPETQEVVKPHSHFMLFATQNPSGLYAGRKQLSRAFRNRFLEVHFDDVPQSELQFILSERCRIPDSYAKKIVDVFQELGKRRQTNRVFEAKHGFATLRDLFRWGSREASTNYELAANGYMILAERARRQDDKLIVKEVIEIIIKEKILVDNLYQHPPPGIGFLTSTNIIWTSAMKRLFVLVVTALKYNEPVLLVGETGSGKTSVCQLYAYASSKELIMLNCHQSTETSDLIGSQRPIRNRSALQADLLKKCQELAAALSETHSSIPATMDEIPQFLEQVKVTSQSPHVTSEVLELQIAFSKAYALFEWKDGPLVQAMQEGNVFLLDEISLADDSVLERLNSVLEPHRTVVLAEKGGVDIAGATVVAHPEFKLVATMNPGGDYGKKELSPALRNRFTEIWVPSIDSVEDLRIIVDSSWQHECLRLYTHPILSFRRWINSKLDTSTVLSMRDILTVVTFMNKMVTLGASMGPSAIFHHAIHMACLDGLETSAFTASWTLTAISQLRQEAEIEISKIVSLPDIQRESFNFIRNLTLYLAVGPFRVMKGSATFEHHQTYNHIAPTTLSNIGRLSRACQLDKAILLEGSPGVGKTSLVSALSHLACQNLLRINLSEQTELIDLFGTDYPVENGRSGSFAWKEAAFLQSMRKGDWVLLDEMNLATQTVLEGLNAVLDHRGSVYIPELGQTYPKHENFRMFAAQNPVGQGGGRKGLPKSFLDRFTKVYIQTLTSEDMYMICRDQFPNVQEDWIRSMVLFNSRLQETVSGGYMGKDGGPWEFNIRDVLRWASLLSGPHTTVHPSAFLDPLYIQRFRTSADRERVINIFGEVFGAYDLEVLQQFAHLSISKEYIQLGARSIKRGDGRSCFNVIELQRYRRPLSALGICMDKGWLAIVSGAPKAGKTHLIRFLASITGVSLHEISLSSGMDTGDILGSFEQVGDDNDSAVQFGWVDGPLLSAMRKGHWLLFDNANLCSPSVLDRLNSLCEPNGYVSLSERGHINGSTEIIYPHPDFRLIIVLDPRNGELSRAMRNRGIEIHLLDTDNTKQDLLRLHDVLRVPPLCYSKSLEGNALEFELIRRGCSRGRDLELDSSVVLRSGALIYDSALMQLLDNMMLRKIFDSQDRSLGGYASTDLLVRHFTPAAFPFLGSYETLFQDKQNTTLVDILRRVYMDGNLLQVRSNYITVIEKSLHVPPAISLSQPLDILSRHEAWSYMNNALAPLAVTFTHIIGLVVRLHLVTTLRIPEQSLFQQSISYYSSPGEFVDVSLSTSNLYPLYCETLSFVSRMISRSMPNLLEQPDVLHEMEILIDIAEHLRDSALGPLLNFSSAMVIKRWYLDILNKRDEAESLRGYLEKFSEGVRLTSGSKMHEIWKAFTPPQIVLHSKELSLIGPSPSTSETEIACDDQENAYPSALVAMELEWLLSIYRELLEIPGRTLRDSGQLIHIARHFTNGVSHCSLLLTHASSMLENGKETLPNAMAHVTLCLKQWMATANSPLGDRDPSSVARSGPAILLTPVLLRDIFLLCSGNITFRDLNKQRAGLTSHARILFEQCCERSLDRLEQIYTLWMGSIFLFANCFKDTYSSTDWKTAHNALVNMDISALAASLIKTSDEELSKILSKRIPPMFGSLGQGQDISPFQLARAWIEFGLCLLDLYLPNFPVDPLAIEKSAFDLLRRKEERMFALYKFSSLAAVNLYGDKSTPLSSMFHAELKIVREDLRKHPDPCFRSVDLSRLQSLFDEIRPFMKQTILNGKLSNIFAALSYPASSVLSQEMLTVCASITGFLRRLDKSYSDLSDIVHPISLALLFIQFGSHLFKCEMNPTGKSPFSHLIKFPTIAAVYQTEATMHDNSDPEQLTFSLVASAYHFALEYKAIADFTQFDKICGKIAALWIKQNDVEEQQKKAAQSLYRHKAMDDLSADDHEFHDLFPSFLEETSPSSETTSKQTPVRSLVLSQDLKDIICATHQMITCDIEKSLAFMKLEEQYWRMRYDSLSELLKREESIIESEKDTLPMKVSLIWKYLMGYSHPNLSYNFYHDSNVSETQRALAIIDSLQQQLQELIQQWPDQMILQHILDRCNYILGLNVYSPIARVLAHLEQLMLRLVDWESYASRENSLAHHQKALTDTIISWRRMELVSWSSLFEAETFKFELDTTNWWVRMHDLTIKGPLHTDDLDTYLGEMISNLDNFFSTSSLGLFKSRLQLVASFAEHIHRIMSVNNVERSERLLRVERILRNLYNYYAQFGSVISRVVKEKRLPLEKELQDYVRLASWKDTNVYALQQSAQRTHRQLYKCIRKFRELLKESATPFLSGDELASEPESSATIDFAVMLTTTNTLDLPVAGNQTMPEQSLFYFTNLSQTLVKFRQILQQSNQRYVEYLPYRRIDNLAGEIMSVSTQLRTETDAAGPDTKVHKVLLMRKRRAWVDLLQGLKSAGFSNRIKPNVLRRQMDRLWLLDRPLLLIDDDAASTLMSKNRAYFDRLLVSLPNLRNSIATHHSDITTGDLERALNFVESCYSFFLSAYAKYVVDYNQYRVLRETGDRLLSLSKADNSNIYVVEFDVIRSWHRACLGLQDALRELLLICNRLSELNSSFSLSSYVLSDISQNVDILKRDGETLNNLQQKGAYLCPSYMSSGETDQFRTICTRIATISQSLQRWEKTEARLQHFCRPIHSWLKEFIPSEDFSIDPQTDHAVPRDSEKEMIDTLLLTAQQIRSRGFALNENPESNDVAVTSASLSADLSATLNLKHVAAKVKSFLSHLTYRSSEDRLTAVRRVSPFLDTYLRASESMLNLQAFHGKALGKLTYVLTRLILSISQNGFCKPPDAEGQQTDDKSNGQLESGAGFGEGTGKTDVGNDIKDEKQIEGLQDEPKEKDGDHSRDQDGLEMDGVEGEMQDVDADESGSEFDEPQSDIEDVVENLDQSSLGKIDEKLWEAKHEENKPQDDQAGKDSQSAGEKVAPQTSDHSNPLTEEISRDDNVASEDDLPEADAPPVDAGKQLENSVQQESVLDLPDDIKIDEAMDDLASDMEDINEDPNQGVEETASQLDAQSVTDDELAEKTKGYDQQSEMDSVDEDQNAPSMEDIVEGNMEDSGRGERGAASKPVISEDTSMADDKLNETNATDTAAESMKKNLSNADDGFNQRATMSAVDNTAMDIDQNNDATEKQTSTGDLSKPVHRIWEEISSANAMQTSVSSFKLPSRVEYLPENLDDPNDLQALGPAKDKQTIANEDIQMPDEEMTGHSNANDDYVHLSDSMIVSSGKKVDESRPSVDRPRAESQAPESHEPSSGTSENIFAEAQMLDMLGDVPISEENVENIIRKWYDIGRPESLAGHVWRLYESLTRDLSFTLCEQLRLTLAPTLATRLQGDFKTGKKLNMKKIIPYIASDYTKDKIWLRRTRPSRREYQILIALDDSRSMGESHYSVHLAYETLALVTKALNRLEAGDVAVASFGECFEVVHRFEDGIVGEREGEKLMKSFKFSQSKTDILELIQSSVNTLLEARERRPVSSSSDDLWQLEIIVSDGICQDHEQLRSALRMAEENRILIVFVVLDSLHDQKTNGNQLVQSSILTMNQVSYQNVNGKLELQLTRYLDSFPFQYYLILREIEALPNVLASTLRQFFEKISER